ERAVLRGGVGSLAFRPDGKLLAVGGARVTLWDVAAGKEVATLAGASGPVAFHPDSKLLASGKDDKTIRLWDLDTRQERAVLQDSTSHGIASLAFTADGRTLVSSGGVVKMWDVFPDLASRSLRGHEDGVASVAFPPDGSLLATGGDDGSARLWDS